MVVRRHGRATREVALAAAAPVRAAVAANQVTRQEQDMTKQEQSMNEQERVAAALANAQMREQFVLRASAEVELRQDAADALLELSRAIRREAQKRAGNARTMRILSAAVWAFSLRKMVLLDEVVATLSGVMSFDFDFSEENDELLDAQQKAVEMLLRLIEHVRAEAPEEIR